MWEWESDFLNLCFIPCRDRENLKSTNIQIKKGRQQEESLFLWGCCMEVPAWPPMQQCACLCKGRGGRWAQQKQWRKGKKTEGLRTRQGARLRSNKQRQRFKRCSFFAHDYKENHQFNRYDNSWYGVTNCAMHLSISKAEHIFPGSLSRLSMRYRSY